MWTTGNRHRHDRDKLRYPSDLTDAAWQLIKPLIPAVRNLAVEIVQRTDTAKGIVVQPKRWIVERSIAWLNRCRRLAKDWENRNHIALAFPRLASIRLTVRKPCNPT